MAPAMVAAFFAGSTILELGMMQSKRSMLKKEKQITEMQFEMQREQQGLASLQTQIQIEDRLKNVLASQNVLFGMQNRRRSGSNIALQQKSVGRAEQAKSFEKLNRSFAMAEINMQATQSARQYNQANRSMKIGMITKAVSGLNTLNTGMGFTDDFLPGGR